MGIFSVLFEAKYKGGKRRRRVGIGSQVKWDFYGRHLFTWKVFHVVGFDEDDVDARTTNIRTVLTTEHVPDGDISVSYNIQVWNDRGSSEVVKKDSIQVRMKEKDTHTMKYDRVMRQVNKYKKAIETHLKAMGIIRGGQIVTYFYKG